ncbi:MAG: hypothetical protein K1X74_04045 [Pirellulales bacterium]|nr:hypothetical protein [Pirellulales bacterium]
MRTNFTILAGLWAVLLGALAAPLSAQPPAAIAAAPESAASTAGQGGRAPDSTPQARQALELQRRMLGALETHRSVQARVRFQARVMGEEMLGTGLYLQGPTEEYRYRLELRMQIGEQSANQLQVCDGQSLWIQQQMLNHPTVYRVDVPSTLFALATRRQAAGHAPFPRTPGLGGLPRVVRELDEAFEFRCLGQTNLGKLPVWVLSGRWRDHVLDAALPKVAAARRAGKPVELPDHLPSHVVQCLGVSDFFPYRTEYRRDVEALDRFTDRLDDPEHLMLRLELFEVRINAAIDPGRFTFSPGDFPVVELTDAYQKQLGVAPVE